MVKIFVFLVMLMI